MNDPRVTELCNKMSEPSPYAILMTCLSKNYGLGDTNVKTDLKPAKNKQLEFYMKVDQKEVSQWVVV